MHGRVCEAKIPGVCVHACVCGQVGRRTENGRHEGGLGERTGLGKAGLIADGGLGDVYEGYCSSENEKAQFAVLPRELNLFMLSAP